jgi:hypothetical protein
MTDNDPRDVRRLNAAVTIITLCVLAAFTPLELVGEGPLPSELEVKAAFVVNFINFVYWPSIPGEEHPDLPICALANSDFADAVRKAAEGKMVGKRSISFRIDPNPNLLRCRVLIVDAGEYQTARPALNAIKNDAMLTIGNGPGLIQIGGMFELIVQDRKVQFDTNLESIRRAKLEVSSRLLELSRNLRKSAN